MRKFAAVLTVAAATSAAAQELPRAEDLWRRADALAHAEGTAMPAPPAAPVSDGPRVTGDFPGVASAAERVLADVWAFIKTLGGARADLPPPILYFSRFDPSQQDPEWTRWQSEWLKSHPEVYADWVCNYSGARKYPEPLASGLCRDKVKMRAWLESHTEVEKEFPFPPAFRAFHYDGTDRIQIDPYTTYEGSLLQGVALRDLGYGYYVTGHEMLHYALDSRGVPGETHHCLFITPQPPDGKSPMQKLADFLIDERHYSHFFVRQMGYGAEVALNPCGRAP